MKLVAIGAVAGGILALALVGCGTGGDRLPSDRVAVQRLAGSEAGNRDDAVPADAGTVFRWRFSTHSDLGRWTFREIAWDVPTGSSTAVLTATGFDPRMSRQVKLRAAQIDTLTVECSDLMDGDVIEVFWAGPREEFSAERRLSTRVGGVASANDGFRSASFFVRGHPLWAGRIDRIRLDLPQSGGRTYRLRSVAGSLTIPRKDAVSHAMGKNWRADYRGEVRTVRLAAPIRNETWSVQLPSKPLLRFSYLLEPGVRYPVTFRVRVFKGEAGGRQVFEDKLLPAEHAKSELVERSATVDLSSFSNREVLIRFETESEVGLEHGVAFPAWSEIEIIDLESVQDRPNVLIIDLDTLRADRLSCYGHTRRTSPAIDAWAANEGVLFEHVAAPSPWTLPSHISMFTGMDCLTHGLNMNDRVPDSLTMIAEILADAGYATRAITGGGYLSDSFNLMQGFGALSYWYLAKLDPAETGNDLEQGVEAAINWIQDRTRRDDPTPFFLLLHSYEVHVPYRAREPFFSEFAADLPISLVAPVHTRTRPARPENGFMHVNEFTVRRSLEDPQLVPVEDDEIAAVNALYDSGVAYADQWVGRLLAYLRDSSLAERTIVILTSDHGESLGESGLAGHSTLESWEISVPLIISGPGVTDHRLAPRVSGLARTIDIAPTILDLVGLEALEGVDGESLVPVLSDGHDAQGSPALSYAASTNNGASLWMPSMDRFLFNNSPWRPIWGAERLERGDSGSDVWSSAQEPSAGSSRNRAALEHEFGRRKSGLRMRLSNPGSAVLLVEMRGEMVTPFRVKSFDAGRASFTWSPPLMRVEIPPSGSLTVFFEGLPKGEIRFRVGNTAARGQDEGGWEVVDFGDGANEWLLVDQGGRLTAREVNQAGREATVVRLWIHGTVEGAGEEFTLDEETAQALRNLGYIQ